MIVRTEISMSSRGYFFPEPSLFPLSWKCFSTAESTNAIAILDGSDFGYSFLHNSFTILDHGSGESACPSTSDIIVALGQWLRIQDC